MAYHRRKSAAECRAYAKWRVDMLAEQHAGSLHHSIDLTRIVEGSALPEVETRWATTTIEIASTDTASAAIEASRRGERVCLLDFASYLSPGGGFLSGAQAQEEALCAHSSLYPALDARRDDFYEPNRSDHNDDLYYDRGLYVPDVLLFSGDEDVAAKVDVAVVAAPFKGRAMMTWGVSEQVCDRVMGERARFAMDLMATASDEPVQTAITGALGCGAFRNDPKVASEAFLSWLEEHPGAFERVVFAIPGGSNLAAFEETFAGVASVPTRTPPSD